MSQVWGCVICTISAPTVAEAMENLKQALGEAYAVEDHLKELLQAAGLM